MFVTSSLELKKKDIIYTTKAFITFINTYADNSQNLFSGKGNSSIAP
ncbi:hypothetical protein GXM_06636 [Nostoc sphaeroides CCNUC1]|uniref:Uncharacterized protein n=1 Tax=Nostoc sphaeroides CCNUC1 TaxID=2653204 RepID=A0A5P8W9B2_9NOSO|nr:hypothetical protein GXM_06636 [Nostoc sphaeroides CCNUC1]